jgi:hypothetical protein
MRYSSILHCPANRPILGGSRMGRAKSPTLRGLLFLKAPGGVEVLPVTVLRTGRAIQIPLLDHANGNAAVGSNNITASTFGFAGGMDYHVSPYTVVGFALAGAGTNWGLPMPSALDAAMRCKPAPMASAGSARPTSPARLLSPITGSPPTARRSAIR